MAESDWCRDPNVSLTDKWRRFREERGRRGEKGPHYLNKWVPWYFFSVLFGAYAWYALAAVPAHHFRDPIWYTINEMFGLYVEIQLLVNWILIHKTDSSYLPGSGDSAALLLEEDVFSCDMSAYRTEVTCSNGDATLGTSGGDSASHFSDTSVAQSDGGDGMPQETPTNPTEQKTSAMCRQQQKTDLTFQMMVATEISSGGEVQRRSFPYWSWVPCLWCRRLRPPRCHHCTLCGRCVLKRDHHCYFTRACIGVNNQRHFLIFLFWCIVMTSLASCEVIPYALDRVVHKYSYWNLIFPVNLISVMSGQLPLLYFHLILMGWSLVFLFFISVGMFSVHLFVTLRGITKFEFDNRIKIVDTRPMFVRLRSVMGRNWGFAVLLPGYINGPPLENGIKWPFVKP